MHIVDLFEGVLTIESEPSLNQTTCSQEKRYFTCEQPFSFQDAEKTLVNTLNAAERRVEIQSITRIGEVFVE